MADKARRLPANAEGAFYVDDTCIACEACVAELASVFCMVDGLAVVQAQPKASELEACQACVLACPVQAIGQDG